MRKILVIITFLACTTTQAFAQSLDGDIFIAALHEPTLADVVTVGTFSVAPYDNIFDLSNNDGIVTVEGERVVIQFDTNTPFANAAFHGFSVTDNTKSFGGIFVSNELPSASPFSQWRVTTIGNKLFVNFAGYTPSKNDSVILTLAPVPEPATYAMWLTGLAAMFCLARRRKQSWAPNPGLSCQALA